MTRKNTIDIAEALRLYQELRNWRLAALRMRRPNGQPFTAGALQAAVRRHDRRPA